MKKILCVLMVCGFTSHLFCGEGSPLRKPVALRRTASFVATNPDQVSMSAARLDRVESKADEAELSYIAVAAPFTPIVAHGTPGVASASFVLPLIYNRPATNESRKQSSRTTITPCMSPMTSKSVVYAAAGDATQEEIMDVSMQLRGIGGLVDLEVCAAVFTRQVTPQDDQDISMGEPTAVNARLAEQPVLRRQNQMISFQPLSELVEPIIFTASHQNINPDLSGELRGMKRKEHPSDTCGLIPSAKILCLPYVKQ